MPKRSSSESDLDLELNELEQKPDLSSSEQGSDDYTPKSVKRSKGKKGKTIKAGKKESRDYKVWTAEEDRIFMNLMFEHVKNKMWEVVKEDGRLAYRGNPGVRAHTVAVLNKLKKT